MVKTSSDSWTFHVEYASHSSNLRTFCYNLIFQLERFTNIINYSWNVWVFWMRLMLLFKDHVLCWFQIIYSCVTIIESYSNVLYVYSISSVLYACSISNVSYSNIFNNVCSMNSISNMCCGNIFSNVCCVNSFSNVSYASRVEKKSWFILKNQINRIYLI